MAKTSPKIAVRETLELYIEAQFEGDLCVAARIVNPYLSYDRTLTLGRMLIQLADALADLNKWQDEEKDLQAKIGILMHGIKP